MPRSKSSLLPTRYSITGRSQLLLGTVAPVMWKCLWDQYGEFTKKRAQRKNVSRRTIQQLGFMALDLWVHAYFRETEYGGTARVRSRGGAAHPHGRKYRNSSRERLTAFHGSGRNDPSTDDRGEIARRKFTMVHFPGLRYGIGSPFAHRPLILGKSLS